jgi:hypothetical protein
MGLMGPMGLMGLSQALHRSGGTNSGQATGRTQQAPSTSSSHGAPGGNSFAQAAPSTGQSSALASVHGAAPLEQLPSLLAVAPYCMRKQSFQYDTPSQSQVGCP